MGSLAPDLLARLVRLEEALRVLGRLASQASTLEAYRQDDALRDRVERNFQVAIEAIIDVANSLIARRRLRVPSQSGEAFDVLAEAGFLDARNALELRRWVGFRNVLVHEYAGVDHEIVFRALTIELDTLRAVAGGMAKLAGEE